MFFISMLAVVVVCAHLWVGLAAPVPDLGMHAGQIASFGKEGWPWSLNGDETNHFGVRVPDAIERPAGRDSREINYTDIQFGVAGDAAIELQPPQTGVA
ncbi:hypothetical protein FOMPIDRAFT_1048118 [Fomitopsis schrenkii]|uniref:Uncharacterized protein n=1 Tax=Fomitopsis schrenkii TaxID=2126942 RepID=S8FL64_FOMSC|nr:hypothetical protein FOMPIDRAFT_1048118 [Fomitopsis schrenkii]